MRREADAQPLASSDSVQRQRQQLLEALAAFPQAVTSPKLTPRSGESRRIGRVTCICCVMSPTRRHAEAQALLDARARRGGDELVGVLVRLRADAPRHAQDPVDERPPARRRRAMLSSRCVCGVDQARAGDDGAEVRALARPDGRRERRRLADSDDPPSVEDHPAVAEIGRSIGATHAAVSSVFTCDVAQGTSSPSSSASSLRPVARSPAAARAIWRTGSKWKPSFSRASQ